MSTPEVEMRVAAEKISELLLSPKSKGTVEHYLFEKTPPNAFEILKKDESWETKHTRFLAWLANPDPEGGDHGLGLEFDRLLYDLYRKRSGYFDRGTCAKQRCSACQHAFSPTKNDEHAFCDQRRSGEVEILPERRLTKSELARYFPEYIDGSTGITKAGYPQLDLLIADKRTKTVLVIENKMGSGVHGSRLGSKTFDSQLFPYQLIAEKLYPDYDRCYIVLSPLARKISDLAPSEQTEHLETEAGRIEWEGSDRWIYLTYEDLEAILRRCIAEVSALRKIDYTHNRMDYSGHTRKIIMDAIYAAERYAQTLKLQRLDSTSDIRNEIGESITDKIDSWNNAQLGSDVSDADTSAEANTNTAPKEVEYQQFIDHLASSVQAYLERQDPAITFSTNQAKALIQLVAQPRYKQDHSKDPEDLKQVEDIVNELANTTEGEFTKSEFLPLKDKYRRHGLTHVHFSDQQIGLATQLPRDEDSQYSTGRFQKIVSFTPKDGKLWRFEGHYAKGNKASFEHESIDHISSDEWKKISPDEWKRRKQTDPNLARPIAVRIPFDSNLLNGQVKDVADAVVEAAKKPEY